MTEHSSEADRPVELTSVQRSLLASHLNSPGHGHQNAALIAKFAPGVDPDRLMKAFDHVVEQTDALRLKLHLDAVDQAVVAAKFSNSTTRTQQTRSELIAWGERRARQAINLEKSCFESRLAEHEDGSLSWYLNLHHIINDGSSAAVVVEAVERVYKGETFESQPYFGTKLERQATEEQKAFWQQRAPMVPLEGLYAVPSRDSALSCQMAVDFETEMKDRWQKAASGSFRRTPPRVG